jgi:hypothetical protein
LVYVEATQVCLRLNLLCGDWFWIDFDDLLYFAPLKSLAISWRRRFRCSIVDAARLYPEPIQFASTSGSRAFVGSL